jgi:hypothetical protein
VFSLEGLTLSDLRKSLLEGTLEAIMWVKWGSVDWSDSKVDSDCIRVSELFRTEFLDTTINNCQTG